MTRRSAVFAAVLLSLACAVPSLASAQIADSTIPLKTVISETNTFRAEFAEYYNNKDISRLMSLYADNAVRIASDGSVETGIEAIRKSYTEKAGTMAHIVITSDTLIAFGSTAIDLGTVKAHPPGGGEVVSHYLVVLRRSYRQWKIVRAAVVPVTK